MDLYTRVGQPVLDQPVLVLGMEGWIDAGVGAATAIAALLASRTTEVVARFDDDVLLDQRARRPVVHIVDGVNTGLSWPTIEVRSGSDDAGRHVLFLIGPEPDVAWRGFTAAVVELAMGWGVRLVVGLGAFPAPAPHTRPVRLVSTAATADLARAVGYLPGSLDVPAGIHAALEEAFAKVGLPAVGLWARVPHYVATMPYPAASAALVDGLAALAGLTLDSSDLHGSALRTRSRIDELIANSDEHRQLIAQLEAQVDAEAEPGGDQGGGVAGASDRPGAGLPGLAGQPLPSGDELAAELERFLRGEGGG